MTNRRRFWTFFGIGVPASVVFFLLVTFIMFKWFERDLPPASAVENYEPPLATRVFDWKGVPVHDFFEQRRIPVGLDDISPMLVATTLVIEDRDFWNHWGVDIFAVLRAVIRDIRAGRVVEGASTISQQLARDLFLTRETQLVRKIREALLAGKIERYYSKGEILEMYLNQMYYGAGAYGVEAASQIYFGRHAAALTLAQCATLAALLRSPSAYCPFDHPEVARARRRLVLEVMAHTGRISREEARVADEEPLLPEDIRWQRNEAPYFVENVRRQLEVWYGRDVLYRGGVTVHTTLDLTLQRIANRVMNDWLQQVEENWKLEPAYGDTGTVSEGKTHYLQGALLAMDPHTGEIRAMVGGRNFRDSQFNRATQARRQPGSAFKPFVYVAAIDNGFTVSDRIVDAPIMIEVGDSLWKPDNYDGRFLGPVTLRTGLAKSRNLVAVRLFQQVSGRPVIEYSRMLGIESSLMNVPSLALGSRSVTLQEMVTAYSAFANGGERVYPSMIKRLIDRDGNVMYENISTPVRVLSPETAYIMASLLNSVIEDGTGRGARWRGFRRPAAGKTGTTNEFTDCWFIGFTPDLVCGVWVGFDDPRTIGMDATGAAIALPAWTAFMKEATQGQTPTDFLMPEGIVEREVCLDTGLLASARCSRVGREVFIAGTEPTRICIHQTGRFFEEEPESDHELFEEMDRQRSRARDEFEL